MSRLTIGDDARRLYAPNGPSTDRTFAETMPRNAPHVRDDIRDDAGVVRCPALSKAVHGGTNVVVAKTPTNL